VCGRESARARAREWLDKQAREREGEKEGLGQRKGKDRKKREERERKREKSKRERKGEKCSSRSRVSCISLFFLKKRDISLKNTYLSEKEHISLKKREMQLTRQCGARANLSEKEHISLKKSISL